ncbi:hypothetical protein BIV57_21795 [Mangrovactinospora gilvigrisea]|uniref:Secreted protein n=1 Tax=Mangrovactinospora gilvigrisea TaxID=1428644 RepID=A0A1J7C6X0_9ACTN|nr:hypothetical protein [Mangrovactinospora gilvigrisea]OIV35394.1 hypothetical protein BIV57_21795 [Mangrovactinospora gilvigrisea]
MEQVLIALLVFVAVVFGVGVYAAVKAKRALEQRFAQRAPIARRRAEDLALRARTLTRPGTPGRVAQLRLDLRTSLDSTRRVLEAGASTDPQLTEALQLCERLEKQAVELDGELRMLEQEPSTGRERLKTKLPELADRAERIGHAADSLRWAAQDRARHTSEDELTELSREVEMEAGALRHWAPSPVEGNAPRREATAKKRDELKD